MTRIATRLLAVAAAVLLTGCMSLNSGQQVHPQTWQLVTPITTGLDIGAPQDAVLMIARVQPLPGYDTAAMAYRESEHEIRYYAHNRWSDRPARQLQPILVEHLENRSLFSAVVASPATVTADYRLEVELLYLEHDLRQAPGQARLGLRVRLISQPGQEILLNSTIRTRAAMGETTPRAGVEAANQALAQALETLETQLRQRHQEQ